MYVMGDVDSYASKRKWSKSNRVDVDIGEIIGTLGGRYLLSTDVPENKIVTGRPPN